MSNLTIGAIAIILYPMTMYLMHESQNPKKPVCPRHRPKEFV